MQGQEITVIDTGDGIALKPAQPFRANAFIFPGHHSMAEPPPPRGHPMILCVPPICAFGLPDLFPSPSEMPPHFRFPFARHFAKKSVVIFFLQFLY
jgi:hypothetical protein